MLIQWKSNAGLASATLDRNSILKSTAVTRAEFDKIDNFLNEYLSKYKAEFQLNNHEKQQNSHSLVFYFCPHLIQVR